MNDLNWQLTSSELLYETTGKGLRVQKRMYTCEDGRTKTVELKDEGPFVHTFAITTEGNIILIRQFRVGPDKYFFESPAGQLNPNEDPKIAAMRELAEESGYTSQDIEELMVISDSAYSTAKRFLYLVKNCIRTSAQNLEEVEINGQKIPRFKLINQSS